MMSVDTKSLFYEFYNEFLSKDKSSEVLKRYLGRLEPKNIFDRLFCYRFVSLSGENDFRMVKYAAVVKILSDRKQNELEQKAKIALENGASCFS